MDDLTSSLASLGNYVDNLSLDITLPSSSSEEEIQNQTIFQAQNPDLEESTTSEEITETTTEDIIYKNILFDQKKLDTLLASVQEEEYGHLIIFFEWLKTVLRKIVINPSKFKSIFIDDEDVIWKLAFSFSDEIIEAIGFENHEGVLSFCAEPRKDAIKMVEGLLNQGIEFASERLRQFEKKMLCGNFSLSRSFLDFSESCRFTVGFSDSIGRRPSMEDELVIAGMGPRKRANEDFYGVFDGHGGNEASTFVATHISDYLRKNLYSTNNDIQRAMYLSFEQMDKSMCDKNMRSGTCAICMFAAEDKFYIANTGDSRAVLGRMNKTSQRLSTDHNLESQSEIDRINNAGGVIKIVRGVPRINGKIAVSRSLGDSEHAEFVVFDPELTEYEYSEDNLFVILACDGIWDVLTDQEAVDIVFGESDPEDAAAALIKESYDRNSDDNMSVVIVYLKEREDWGDEISESIKNGSIEIKQKETYSVLQQKQLMNPITKTKGNPIGSKRNRFGKKRGGKGKGNGKNSERKIVFEQQEIPPDMLNKISTPPVEIPEIKIETDDTPSASPGETSDLRSPRFDDLDGLSSSSSSEDVFYAPVSSSSISDLSSSESSDDMRPRSF